AVVATRDQILAAEGAENAQRLANSAFLSRIHWPRAAVLLNRLRVLGALGGLENNLHSRHASTTDFSIRSIFTHPSSILHLRSAFRLASPPCPPSATSASRSRTTVRITLAGRCRKTVCRFRKCWSGPSKS